MNNATNHRLHIWCFLYNSIRLWRYMNVNNLIRNMSGSMIPIIILNIFKRKRRRSATSFLMKCFEFLVFLLLPREAKEDKEEEENE